jgi:hypothetical protein
MTHKEQSITASRYQDHGGNYGILVLPAGKQHDGKEWIQFYHTIFEDYHEGSPNGQYKLVDEFELIQMLGTNYIEEFNQI